MTDRSASVAAPSRRHRRAAVVAAAVVVTAVGGAVVLVLVRGARAEPASWSLVVLVAALVVALVVVGLVVASWAAGRTGRGVVDEPRDRVPHDVGPADALDGVDIDLVGDPLDDPLAPIPDDQAVLAAQAGAIDLTRGPTVRVVLHPGPVTRRRLSGRPDALVIVADAEALDVPGWIVEGRSRLIDRADRVVVPWRSIARFRVRADRNGPDTYDITAHPDDPPPRGWRIRRDEIADEVTLLDHVRRVGRITIELEDSIRS